MAVFSTSFDETHHGVIPCCLCLQICELEEGHKAFAFSTGMAALSAVTRLVKTGQEIILNNDSYGGTYRLLSKVTRPK